MSLASDPTVPPVTGLVRDLPKVELHCHLEGAIRGDSLLEIVNEFALNVPITTPAQLASAVQTTQEQRSLASWRPLFDTLRQAFRTPDLVSRLTLEVVEDYAAQNSRHVELRFSPLMMQRHTGIATNDAIGAVEAGLREARQRFGLSAVGIVLVTRDATPPDEAAEVARLSTTAAERGIIAGFDIAGQEIGNPASRFADALDIARASGLGITIHAGEECGPEAIREAVTLGADRVGHGLSVASDHELRTHLIERGTTLEMCPTSNLLTGNWPDLPSHPAAPLLRHAAAVTLNADDPLVCGNDLTEEYRIGAEELGFSLGDFEQIISNAVNGAFLPHDDRAVLRTSIETEIQHIQGGDQPCPQ